jgi:hypothetical protein
MEKITKREMFEALVAYANACDMDVEINDTAVTSADFVAFATKEIEQLDKKAVKAKERAAAKRAEGDALTEMVLNVLTADFQTAADVAAQIEDEEATVAKVSYRLGALVKEGKAVKEDIKVDRDGKKAVLKGYKLA